MASNCKHVPPPRMPMYEFVQFHVSRGVANPVAGAALTAGRYNGQSRRDDYQATF